MNRTLALVAGCLIGLLFTALTYIYATHSAGTLPHFLPGYAANSTVIHSKHAIATGLLAVCCFIFVWFQTGPDKK